jgi:ABC-type multidrug transport system ATPase subunit
MLSSSFVSVQEVTKEYGRLTAIRNLSLQLEQNKYYLLIGRNGAGKSTLLSMLSGLSQPSVGKIFIDGKDPSHVENKNILSVISHDSFLYSNLTAQENLIYYAKMYSINNMENRVKDVLKLVNLSTRRLEPVKNFSRGMTQRLTIARSLLHQPKILLLDEPFTGLDQAAIRDVSIILKNLSEQGTTLLLTTHDIHLGVSLTDEYIVLENQTVAETGVCSSNTAEELNRKYFMTAGEVA